MTMRDAKTPIVILETPYAGDIKQNLCYARAAMRDCLMRGEAPYASHLLYTQDGVLNDDIPEERDHGIQAGFAFRAVATKTVVYDDLGISHGMRLGIEHSLEQGIPVEYRRLPEWARLRRSDEYIGTTRTPETTTSGVLHYSERNSR